MGSAHGDFRQGRQAAGEVLRRRRLDATGDADREKGASPRLVFRYQIDHRERVMGLGSARVVSLAEARAKANECRKLLAAGIDPLGAPQRRTHGRPRRRTAHRHVPAMPRRIPDQPRRPLAREACSGNGRTAWRPMPSRCSSVAVGDIDIAMVVKVIEPEWKRAPTHDGPRAQPDRRGAGLGRGARPAQAGPAADAVEEPSRQAAAASARH